MDFHALNPTCVLKVNINCCNACRKKVKKALLKIDGVYSVGVDTEKKLVSVTGKVDPKKLIKMLSKIGKKAELLSYEKEPKNDHNQVEGQSKNTNINHDKNNIRRKEKEIEEEDRCCHDDFNHDFEAYVAPKEFDDQICRDVHCKLHTRNMIIRNSHMPPSDNGASMIRHHPHHSRGHFYGGGPPGRSHNPGFYREEPPPYGPYRPRMPPPAYGGFHPRRPMPGLDNFTDYFNDENTRGCSIM